MKISEAMRQGAKRGKQTFGILYSGEGDSCAMGAIGLGLGWVQHTQKEILYPILRTNYPFLTQQARCPDCGLSIGEGTVIQTIIHLNNEHQWSREKIADYIESAYEKETLIPVQEIREYMSVA